MIHSSNLGVIKNLRIFPTSITNFSRTYLFAAIAKLILTLIDCFFSKMQSQRGNETCLEKLRSGELRKRYQQNKNALAQFRMK